MSDLRTRILAAQRKMSPVDIQDWGFPVFVRRMTSIEREIFRKELDKPDTDWPQQQRIIISTCMCDESGARVFDNPDDLKSIDSAILDKLSSAVSALSHVSKDAEEEIKKKSMIAESSGSGSSLPENLEKQ